jgi:putative DNA primase/helicase
MSAGSTAGTFRPEPDLRVVASDGETVVEKKKPKAKRPHQAKDVHEAIDILADCDIVEFEGYRKTVAKEWNLRAAVLESMVEAKRREKRPEAVAEDMPESWKVEPAATPQSAADILEAIVEIIRRHIVISHEGAIACALWVMFTWVHDVADFSPILNIKSPTKRCGKSQLLGALSWLVPKPQLTMSITGPTMYRFIDQCHPTLLIDESDALQLKDDEGLRGIINSSFTRGDMAALRMEERNGKFEVKRFSPWCPKAFAGIRDALPETVVDRSITVTIQRKRPSDKVARLRRRFCGAEFDAIKSMLARWSQDSLENLRSADPKLPDSLNDRACDAWELLLAIADMAGGKWPALARKVAVTLSGGTDDEEGESISVQLLADIRDIMGDDDAIFTKTLIARLVALDERPWGEFGKQRKPITPRQLMVMLKPFGVAPDRVRIGSERDRGYAAHMFREVLESYFPPSTPVLSVQVSQTASTDAFNAVLQVSKGGARDTYENDEKTHETDTRDPRTLKKPPEGGKEIRDYNRDPLGEDEFPNIPAFMDRRVRP